MRGARRGIFRKLVLIAFAMCCFLNSSIFVQAGSDTEDADVLSGQVQEQIMDDIGLAEINRFLRQNNNGMELDFGRFLKLLLSRDYRGCVKLLKGSIKNGLFSDLESFRKGYMYVLLFAVMAAVFSNISSVFGNRQIADTGFFMLYLSMAAVVLKTFQLCTGNLRDSLGNLMEFMKILNTSFCMSIGVANGTNTALGVYGLLLISVWVIEAVFVRVLVPAVYLYMAVMVLNYLAEEPFLTKFGALLKKTVIWSIRSVLGVVTGLNLVQGLIGPAADSLKRTALGRTVEAVPGIGDALAGTGDVMAGAAVLIRNGVGAAGMIICIFLCVIPMLRFFIFLFLYRLAGALLEPITDKRISEVLTKAGDGYGLMLYVVFGSCVLFLISAAVVTTTLQ